MRRRIARIACCLGNKREMVDRLSICWWTRRSIHFQRRSSRGVLLRTPFTLLPPRLFSSSSLSRELERKMDGDPIPNPCSNIVSPSLCVVHFLLVLTKCKLFVRSKKRLMSEGTGDDWISRRQHRKSCLVTNQSRCPPIRDGISRPPVRKRG